MSRFTENEYYGRQLILEGFGLEKQEKLRKSHVVVVGAGGLGSPALQYLAGAGVGEITIVDGDKVQAHNLHRQILFSVNDINCYKAETACQILSQHNPFIKANFINDYLSDNNIDKILTNCDVVIDASDNFNTRFLLGDYTEKMAIPLVYAAIYAFEGQLTVFNYKNGPSLRSLFPKIPDSSAIPNCENNGVIGFVPGFLGVLQASEAIKIITDLPTVSSGKLQQIDLLTLKITEFSFQKSEKETQQESKSVSCSTIKLEPMQIKEISSHELVDRLNMDSDSIFLLDVREPHEWNRFNIGGTLIPMLEVDARINEIPRDKDIVVLCHSGYRSYKVAKMLLEHYEFKNVFNLKGGVVAWANEVGE